MRWISVPDPAQKSADKRMNSKKKERLKVKDTVLLHSADRDLTKSLSILLQDRFDIVTTETAEELSNQRANACVKLLVVDLERSIPLLLDEFELRRAQNADAPIIVLYAFRQGKPEWESRIRSLANKVLYKPVQIDQILDAIEIEHESQKISGGG